MSSISQEEKDKKLFEFYVKYGYLPDNFKDINLKNEKVIKQNQNKIEKNKVDIKENPEPAYVSLESEQALFLEALKNSNFNNHYKKLLATDRKNNQKKHKPNIKYAKPKEKLDLHNLTRERALSELKEFIVKCVRYHISPVIIVHGKGFRSEGGIAVLKDTVECYLNTEGREYISYYSDAPANLGGSGAKIVYINY